MGKETDTQQAEQPYLSKLSKLSSRANVCSHCKIQNRKKCKHLPSSASCTAPPLHVHYFLRHGGQGAWLWRALLFALAAAGESFINKKTVWLCCLASCKGCPACLPTCLAVQPFEATLEWRCHGICWWRIFDLPYELKQHLNCIQSAISFAALAGCKSQQGDGEERIRGGGRGIPRQ